MVLLLSLMIVRSSRLKLHRPSTRSSEVGQVDAESAELGDFGHVDPGQKVAVFRLGSVKRLASAIEIDQLPNHALNICMWTGLPPERVEIFARSLGIGVKWDVPVDELVCISRDAPK
jgi:hypothetical protein